jgi:hypothetical protein
MAATKRPASHARRTSESVFLASENAAHAAHAAGQDDHVELVKIDLLHGAVRLHRDALAALDARAADAGIADLHAAAAENVARSDRLDGLKAVSQNDPDHDYPSRQALTYP